MAEAVHLLGVRHHGPGSATSVVHALDDLQPECVLIEGPPEADELVEFAGDASMVPPIALLVYPTKAPEEAAFFPFAEYSPEWCALKWAAANNVPARFIDLPYTAKRDANADADADADAEADAGQEASVEQAGAPDEAIADRSLDQLAQVAGFDDSEVWWNTIEQSSPGAGVFGVIAQAMALLRSDEDPAGIPLREQRREAHMRKAIRTAEKTVEGAIAVVCGAWHVPALSAKVSISADRATLKGITTRTAKSVSACWIPWTDKRLASRSGYGAGVLSPGWYQHLWDAYGESLSPLEIGSRWQTRVARRLRADGYSAATAEVIEATRLAVSLAAIRGLPLPGLSEQQDATLSAMCHGESVALALVRDELVIGSRVGEVSDSVPQPPLQQDLVRWQKKLRLKPEAIAKEIALDLRTETGLNKSNLLRRLNVLGVPWGRISREQAGRGTFRETWDLLWEPELSVQLAEAVVYGPTIEQASAASVVEQAQNSSAADELASLVNAALLAGLPESARIAISCLQRIAAGSGEVGALLRAFPPLAETLRYGSARSLPEVELRQLIEGLVIQSCAGLRYACHQLDEEAAGSMRHAVRAGRQAIWLLDNEDLKTQWFDALVAVTDDPQVAPLLRGQAQRLLFDDNARDGDATALALSRALSPAVPALAAGEWLEGFLDESGELLISDQTLLAYVDTWLAGVDADAFDELLPMIRRAFAGFDTTLRQKMLFAVRSPGKASEQITHSQDLTEEFEPAIALVYQILGVDAQENTSEQSS